MFLHKVYLETTATLQSLAAEATLQLGVLSNSISSEILCTEDLGAAW